MRLLNIVAITLIPLSTLAQEQPTSTDAWTLAKCLNYAAANNITVRQTELDNEAAKATLKQSVFARFPNLSLGGSQSLTRGTSADPITYQFISQTINATSLNLSSQVTLFNGNKINNTVKQNSLIADQKSLYIEEAKNNIVLSVTQAYLEASYYNEGLLIAQNNLAASEKQLQRAEALYKAGSTAAKDYADVKAQYASDQYSVISTKNSLEQKILTLKQLLELEPQTEFSIVFPSIDNELDVVIPDKYEVYNAAVGQMPEIKASELQRNIKQTGVKIAKAGYQPTVTLLGSLATGYTNTQGFEFKDQLKNNYSQRLSLSLNIPIFNNLKNTTNVQTEQIGIRSAELSIISEKKDLYKKIENAYQSATAAQSEAAAAQVQVDAANTSYSLARHQFDVGSLNTVELLIEQNDYLVAQQKYVQSKYNMLLYYLLLQFYQGNEIKI